VTCVGLPQFQETDFLLSSEVPSESVNLYSICTQRYTGFADSGVDRPCRSQFRTHQHCRGRLDQVDEFDTEMDWCLVFMASYVVAVSIFLDLQTASTANETCFGRVEVTYCECRLGQSYDIDTELPSPCIIAKYGSPFTPSSGTNCEVGIPYSSGRHDQTQYQGPQDSKVLLACELVATR
jgi:hypothetical protein